MRVFLIVLLVIVLVLAALMMVTAGAAVRYWDGKLEWSIRVCGIPIISSKKKKKTEKKKKAKKKNEPKAETPSGQDAPQTPDAASDPGDARADEKDKPADKPQEQKKKLLMDARWEKLQKLAETTDLIGRLFFSAPGPLRKIVKGITLYKVETDILVANEDADACARLYGQFNALLCGVLRQAGEIITVKRTKVGITCDFAADECIWNVSARVRVRVGTIVAAGLWFLWNYLRDGRRTKKTIVSKKL